MALLPDKLCNSLQIDLFFLVDIQEKQSDTNWNRPKVQENETLRVLTLRKFPREPSPHQEEEALQVFKNLPCYSKPPICTRF